MTKVENAIPTHEMTREEWLLARAQGIGGSDAGVILGLNKYRTAFELWLEKTGQVTPQEIDNEAIYWGNEMENVVAKEFEKRTGKKVRRSNFMYSHPEYPFIKANVDRLVVGDSAVLECKTASAFLAKEWEDDEIPDTYLVQVQHYLGVTGKEKGYIAVLIGGNRFVWKEIDRDEELISAIFEQEIKFWNEYVQANVAPALDGSSAAEKYLKDRYTTTEEGKTVDLKAEFKNKIEQYHSIKGTIKEMETQAKEIENQIKHEMKDAELGFVQNFRTEWKPVTSNRVDSKKLKENFPDIYQQVVKASSYRKFKIKELS
jgi:putative phage-type endonuclease